jgi:hypothetical protein
MNLGQAVSSYRDSHQSPSHQRSSLVNASQVSASQARRQHMASSLVGLNHSLMAMQAAKRMRNSKQKRKVGHVVCHHLRMMLKADEPVRISSNSSMPVLPELLLHQQPVNDVDKQQFTLSL